MYPQLYYTISENYCLLVINYYTILHSPCVRIGTQKYTEHRTDKIFFLLWKLWSLMCAYYLFLPYQCPLNRQISRIIYIFICHWLCKSLKHDSTRYRCICNSLHSKNLIIIICRGKIFWKPNRVIYAISYIHHVQLCKTVNYQWLKLNIDFYL